MMLHERGFRTGIMKWQGIRFFQHVMKPIHRYAALLAIALTLSGTAAFADQVSFDGYTFNYNPPPDWSVTKQRQRIARIQSIH